MRYGSVCSGIEAVSLAWEPLGMEPAWFAEVDPFCCAVLAHRWPHVPNLGDILAEDFLERARECGAIDILVGGTPCQSFSTAGKRGGLADHRGNLALRFLDIAEELSARWTVWENVPGVLSSGRGRDFGAVLGKMVQLRRGYVYRILDSLGYGVPQRRRRVFLVGHSGGICPREVLFEPEGEGRDSPQGGRQGEVSAAAVKNGTGTVTPCNIMGANRRKDRPNGGVYYEEGAQASKCVDAPGLNPCCQQGGTVVVSADPRNLSVNEHVQTLKSNSGSNSGVSTHDPLVLNVTTESKVMGAYNQTMHDRCPALWAGQHGHTGAPFSVLCHESGQGWWNEADHSGPLRAEGENRPSRPTHVVVGAVGFSTKESGKDAKEGFCPTLRAESGDPHMGGRMAVSYFKKSPELSDVSVEDRALCHESGRGRGNDPEQSDPLKAGEGIRATRHAVVKNQPIPIDLRQASRGGKVTNNRPDGTSGGPPGIGIGESGDPAYTVSERGQAVAIQPIIAVRNNSTGDDGFGVNVSPAMINGGGPIALAIPVLAFDSKKDGCDATECAPTLRAMNHDSSWLNGGGQVGVASWEVSSDAVVQSESSDAPFPSCPEPGATEEYAQGLLAMPADAGASVLTEGPSDKAVAYKAAVRRLTPRECERLQGIPDDHTLVPWKGKPAADSNRYRVVGNSMAVPVLAWIGRRLLQINGENG